MAGPLIHIGYHKTGSTWLQRHLFTGEAAPFFSPLARGDINTNLVNPGPFSFKAESVVRLYHSTVEKGPPGKRPVISHERLSGYPASGGFDSEMIAERLIRTFPDAQILIVLREQRSLLLSWYTQYVRDGGALPLERYLELGLRRGVRRTPLFSPEFYEFDRLIGWYQAALTPANVIVLPYEMLREAPQAFVTAVCKFAGVDMPDLQEAPAENRGTSSVWSQIARIGNSLFRVNPLNSTALWDRPEMATNAHRFARIVSRNVPAAVENWLRRQNEERISAYCTGRFSSSNRRTSEQIGIPLWTYGYDCTS